MKARVWHARQFLLSDRIVMMTNGPAATVGEILDIKLERPRHRLALADDPQYNHYRAAVLSFLYEKQRKPGEGGATPVVTETQQGSADESTGETVVKTALTDEQAA